MIKGLSLKKIVIFLIFMVLGIGTIYNCTTTKKGDYLKNDAPEVKVITSKDNKKHKTIKGNGMWFNDNPLLEGSQHGNSYIVDISKELLENCRFIEVQAEDQILFNIPYEQDLSKVSIGLYDIESKKVTNIELIDKPYEIKAPKDSGEYYYIIDTYWDENHSFEYLFKINIK